MVRLECVPNISEGRRRDVVDACGDAASTRGVRVLHASSDPDHNRTVLTLLGEGDDLAPSVTKLAEAAVERIDVAGHSGVHPFLGALDVTPFVPLEAERMPAAVDAARRGETNGVGAARIRRRPAGRARSPASIWRAAGRPRSA